MDRQRNSGIDMLKVISMLMVVVLHICMHGGLLKGTPVGTLNYDVTWLMEIGAYSAVNIFAMTTGYLMYGKKFRASRLIGVWLQVLFYSLGIPALFSLFTPTRMGLAQLAKSLLPVSLGLHWYVSCYMILLLFAPFLNRLLQAINGRQTVALLVACMIPAALSLLPGNVLAFNAGYSVIWLAIMYVLGAAIRKYDARLSIRKRWCALGYIGAALLIWLSREVIRLASERLLGAAMGEGFLLNYVSPLVVLMAASLLLFFRGVTLPPALGKLAGFLAPLSFAVYLIHEHPLVKASFFSGKYKFLLGQNVFLLVATVLGAALAVFAVCVGMEWLRGKLFGLLRIDRLTRKVGAAVDDKLKLEL